MIECKSMKKPRTAIKNQIESVLIDSFPREFSIKEIAAKVGTDRITASKYLNILQVEGRVFMTRAVGNSKFYRAKSPEKRREINNSKELAQLTKYTFNDFPHPFMDRKSGKTNVLLVSAHSQQEAAMSGISEQEQYKAKVRSGNVADCSFNSLLGFKFGFLSSHLGNGANDIRIMMKPDIHVDMNLMSNHNVILLGAGNVNSVTQRVMRDFWESLPIRFEAPDGHEMIYSELSGNRLDFQSNYNAGILVMVPNIYTTDVDVNNRPNKVVIICAGLEIQGTQAAMLALCKGIDILGNKLTNNAHDQKSPYKIVEAIVQRKPITNLIGLGTQPWDVVDYKFVE